MATVWGSMPGFKVHVPGVRNVEICPPSDLYKCVSLMSFCVSALHAGAEFGDVHLEGFPVSDHAAISLINLVADIFQNRPAWK